MWGSGLIVLGLLIGLAGEMSSKRLVALLVFDSEQTPLLGTMEYRMIAVGYALITCSVVLALRRRFKNRSNGSNAADQ